MLSFFSLRACVRQVSPIVLRMRGRPLLKPASIKPHHDRQFRISRTSRRRPHVQKETVDCTHRQQQDSVDADFECSWDDAEA